MIFWLVSMALLLCAALTLAWPLLAKGSHWKPAGLALLLVIPVLGALLYRDVGTPVAMEQIPASAASADFDALADDLRSRLGEGPEDVEGWLLLNRSLKSLKRYDEALEAAQTAARIAPDDPVVRVELAESMLFASGNPRISDDVRAMLQSAVAQEPTLQKGLWLLGIDAVQRGEDAQAIEYWTALLEGVGDDPGVAASVQDQIDQARTRLGLGSEPSDGGDWAGVTVTVDLSPQARSALPTTLPQSAALFVIVRPAGVESGPPLGVARVDSPAFPLTLSIDDSNAMMPQLKLSDHGRLRFQARLSLAGQAGAQPGDWESAVTEQDADKPALELSLSTAVD